MVKLEKSIIDAKVETSYNTRTITPEFVDGLFVCQSDERSISARNLGMAYQPEELELFRTQMDPDFYPNVDWMDLLLKEGAWQHRGKSEYIVVEILHAILYLSVIWTNRVCITRIAR